MVHTSGLLRIDDGHDLRRTIRSDRAVPTGRGDATSRQFVRMIAACCATVVNGGTR
jgi:hypothetical protein